MCTLILINASTASVRTTTDYMKIHSDIQVAMDDLNIKKAKSIIKILLPMIDSDIEYTATLMSDEEDDFIIKDITTRYNRQKEIKQSLEELLKLKNSDEISEETLNMIKELRRLSLKPKER